MFKKDLTTLVIILLALLAIVIGLILREQKKLTDTVAANVPQIIFEKGEPKIEAGIRVGERLGEKIKSELGK